MIPSLLAENGTLNNNFILQRAERLTRSMTTKLGINTLEYPLLLSIRHVYVHQLEAPVHAPTPPLLGTDLAAPEAGVSLTSLVISPIEARPDL